jgi:N-acetylglucosamine-6-sulfatase
LEQCITRESRRSFIAFRLHSLDSYGSACEGQVVRSTKVNMTAGRWLGMLTLMIFILGIGYAAEAQESPATPNILLILTDDQEASTLEYMPNVQTLADEGKTFENAIFTQPLCCPSRATIQTGLYPHNSEITGNAPPHGGWPVFARRGFQHSTFATWLDDADYNTAYFGKYMNGYSGTRSVDGWDRWVVYSAPSGLGWSEYTNGTRQHRTKPMQAERMVREKALGWLGVASEGEEPFLGVVAFGAPHEPYPHPNATDEMFAGIRAPRNEGFNEADVSDKPAWVRKKPLMSGREIAAVDMDYRNALRSLVNVDRFVGEVIASVPELDFGPF